MGKGGNDLISINVENIIKLIACHLNSFPPCKRRHPCQFLRTVARAARYECHPIPS